ncbi:acyltransferase domain-containing protein [Candidatus Poriferisocius sp.]|uniref:acyltransferase domain-containing protein n=1 Tax=Candidatus Poriferisocius sp. TaxID=3101276 RepID=UPI003B51F9B8
MSADTRPEGAASDRTSSREVVMFPGGGIDMNNMRETPLLDTSYMRRMSGHLGIDFVSKLANGEVGSDPGPYQASVAALTYACTRQRYGGARPMAVIGQSSGVWAAAALMGAIWIEDACNLLMIRGDLIAEASARHGEGRMLSVVGPSPDETAAIVEGIDGCWVSGVMTRSSVTLGCRLEVREDVESALSAELNANVVRLPIDFASHCPLMDGVADELKKAMGDLEIIDGADTGAVEFYDCFTSDPGPVSLDDLRDRLALNIEKPFDLMATVQSFDDDALFVESLPNAGIFNMIRYSGISRRRIIKAA